jgi:hypothetical protein
MGDLVSPVLLARVQVRQNGEQKLRVLHIAADGLGDDGVTAALVRSGVKGLGTAALRVWSSHAQLAITTHQH